MTFYIVDQKVVANIDDINLTNLKNSLLDPKFCVNENIFLFDDPKMPTSLLAVAVQKNDQELIEYLISQCDGTIWTFYRLLSTALRRTIDRNEVELFKKLYQLRVRTNVPFLLHISCLLSDSIRRNLDIANYIIAQGVDVNEIGSDGMSFFHRACSNGSDPAKEVKFLLDHNANVNAVTKDGLTPLHLALSMGNIEVAKILITRGADVNYSPNQSNWQKTIMFDALIPCQKYREFIGLLLNLDEPMTDVNVLYTEQHTQRTQNLLQCELSTNYGRINSCELFLDAAINVDFEDSVGKLAVEYNNDFDNQYKHDIDVIKRHIVKLLAVGLPVCERNRQAVEENFGELKNLCLEEIQNLKIDKISASDISFFDVFSMNCQDLAVRLKFAKLNKVVYKELLRDEYPLYGGMIFFKLSKVKRRIKYLEVLEISVEKTLNEWGLPHSFIKEIWYYFTNIELKKLTTALKC